MACRGTLPLFDSNAGERKRNKSICKLCRSSKPKLLHDVTRGIATGPCLRASFNIALIAAGPLAQSHPDDLAEDHHVKKHQRTHVSETEDNEECIRTCLVANKDNTDLKADRSQETVAQK